MKIDTNQIEATGPIWDSADYEEIFNVAFQDTDADTQDTDKEDNVPQLTSVMEVVPQPPVQLHQLGFGIPAQPFQNVHSYSYPQIDAFYCYNYLPIDYDGRIKNDVVATLAELKLTVMTETPAELARFLSPSVRLTLTDNGKIVIRASRNNNPLDTKEFEEILEKNKSFPYLAAATYYDLGSCPDAEFKFAMLQKAYFILNELEINTENPYLVDVDSCIPPESSYRTGLFLYRPFNGIQILSPRGGMYAPQELYSSDANAPGCIWPLRSLVKADTNYVKPCFLPQKQYHLFGTEKLRYTNVWPVVLTPDLMEFSRNYSYYGMAVLSWYGADYTIPKVDFSQLAGRTVHYAFNPGSFGGDYQRCRCCMERVMELLVAQGCHVYILATPWYERPNDTMPPPHMASMPFIQPNTTPFIVPVVNASPMRFFN